MPSSCAWFQIKPSDHARLIQKILSHADRSFQRRQASNHDLISDSLAQIPALDSSFAELKVSWSADLDCIVHMFIIRTGKAN